MTDYDELVKALRFCSDNEPKNGDCYDCPYDGEVCHTMLSDAAAAIEALEAEVKRLKAENPIVETVLVDKMRQQMEETVCHCNVKENAELIAKILDDDVDGKVYHDSAIEELQAEVKRLEPKRGEWIKLDMHKGMEQYKCSVCGAENYVPECMGEPMYVYCPNCGAKMEVQE